MNTSVRYGGYALTKRSAALLELLLIDLATREAFLEDLTRDPQAYVADVLSRLVNRHLASQIGQLMPWAYTNQVT